MIVVVIFLMLLAHLRWLWNSRIRAVTVEAVQRQQRQQQKLQEEEEENETKTGGEKEEFSSGHVGQQQQEQQLDATSSPHNARSGDGP